MTKKTFRYQPYAIANLEDERYPEFVVQCAALLNAEGQFVFDMGAVEELPTAPDPDPNSRAYSTKFGAGKGIICNYKNTPQHITEPYEGGGIEISTFGL